MARLISSKATFFYKFVFPLLWIAFAGFIIFIVHSNLASFHTRAEAKTARLIVILVLAVVTVIIYWVFPRIKKVELMEDALQISNYSQTIVVPLRDIASVSGSILMDPELIWIRFREPAEFGVKIVFIGQHRFFRGFTRHPVVKELDNLISKW
jgi:predicted PurR-regulated permease PerM